MAVNLQMEMVSFFEPHIENSQETVPSQPSSTGNKNKRPMKEPARYPCSTCGKKFTRSGTLRDHERTHSNDRPFKCNSCNKSFARMKDRERHNKLHTEEKIFTCQGSCFAKDWGCGRKFAREDGLVAHFRSLNGIDDCISSMLEYYPLFWHRLSGGYICVLPKMNYAIGCGNTFDSSDSFRAHLNSSEGNTCKKNLVVEQARCLAQISREKNWQQADQEVFDLVGFWPRDGQQGIDLWIRFHFDRITMFPPKISSVQFGDIIITAHDKSSVWLSTNIREYTVKVKVPPKPTSKDTPQSVSVKLGLRYYFSAPTTTIHVGTFTYKPNPEDEIQTTKIQPLIDTPNQPSPVGYVFPSAMTPNYTPTSNQLQGLTTSASGVYSQAQRGMVNDHRWIWR